MKIKLCIILSMIHQYERDEVEHSDFVLGCPEKYPALLFLLPMI